MRQYQGRGAAAGYPGLMAACYSPPRAIVLFQWGGVVSTRLGRLGRVGAATQLPYCRRWAGTAAAVAVATQQWPVQPVPNDDVCVVRTPEEAERAVGVLLRHTHTAHAWDTEVARLDMRQSPVRNGALLCMSCYAGPDVDFGAGKSRLWVDCWGTQGCVPADEYDHELGNGPPVLQPFRAYFTDREVRLVWHNYSFDAHILRNYGIRPNGLQGDTMHMARLYRTDLGHEDVTVPWPPPSTTPTPTPQEKEAAKQQEAARQGYSLAALTRRLLGREYQKTDMRSLFGVPKLKKDGTPSKVLVVPALEEVQTSCSAEVVQRWVHYSVLDAVSTWELYHLLRAQLIQMPLYTPGVGGVPSVASAGARGGSSSKDATEVMWERTAAPQRVPTMLDLYHSLIVPFSETLINMERRGVCVDREWLLQQSKLAERDCQAAKERFRACLVEGGYVAEEDSGCVLLSSSAQMAHLLFSETGETREFKVENPLYGQPLPPEQQPLSSLPPPSQAKDGVGENDDEDADGGGNASKTKPSQRKKAAPISPKLKMHKKQKVLVLSGMGLGRLSSRRTASGNLSVASTVMDALVKRPVGDFVVGGTEGPRQSQLRLEALEALQEARSIQTMINTFFTNLEAVIQPPHDRVHASLNLNTTTGRLSCQRPNLQNQPALGKDRYRIRQAFVPKEGCKFIVADYSQLELRILAHIAHDQAMLTAFELGGDFHSRTAMSMYDYVAEAVKNGEVRLETGDGGGTEAEEAAVTVPLLKDVFASERSKAKILNFSIAYGKTAYGLAKDFGVSTEDAQATVDSWYAGRPSVKRWQDHTISQGECVDVLHVKTLLGRRRQLTNLRLPRRMKEYKAATRAAINTPIQGSAADIMMMAMIAIEQNARLRELGWDLLLQIHDEVILEGPEESAEEALGIVRDAMMHPISLHPAVAEAAGGGSQRILQVDLVVDAKIGDSWYEAK